MDSNQSLDLPFILSGPEELVSASGCKRVIDIVNCEVGNLTHDAIFGKNIEPGEIVVGALPFERTRAPFLYQPESFTRERFTDRSSASSALYDILGSPSISNVEPIAWRVTPEPSRDGYASNVARALKLMNGTGNIAENEPKECLIKKVVLARSLKIEAEGDIHPADLLRHLRKDPSITCFALPIKGVANAEDRYFVGATPELLIKKVGDKILSHPLAGSIARAQDPDLDREVSQNLLKSEKDLREHAAVVEWIADLLTPYCSELRIPAAPSLVSTNTMWHLGTKIEGTLKDRNVASVELASLLHPTPAVCGTPCDLAYAAIAKFEPFDRGYFAGAVGWCESNGDGQWMVAIRCADVTQRCATLYAGAGIVIGSDPQLEVQETAAKLKTLLNVFGINEEGVPVS